MAATFARARPRVNARGGPRAARAGGAIPLAPAPRLADLAATGSDDVTTHYSCLTFLGVGRRSCVPNRMGLRKVKENLIASIASGQ
jgi:hypothetical protein